VAATFLFFCNFLIFLRRGLTRTGKFSAQDIAAHKSVSTEPPAGGGKAPTDGQADKRTNGQPDRRTDEPG